MKGTDVSVKLQNSKLGKIRIRAYASIKSNQVTTECAAVLQNRPPSNRVADAVKSLLLSLQSYSIAFTASCGAIKI